MMRCSSYSLPRRKKKRDAHARKKKNRLQSWYASWTPKTRRPDALSHRESRPRPAASRRTGAHTRTGNPRPALPRRAAPAPTPPKSARPTIEATTLNAAADDRPSAATSEAAAALHARPTRERQQMQFC